MRVQKFALSTFLVLACLLFAPLSFAQQMDSSKPAPAQMTQRSWLGVSILEVDGKVARHMDIKATKGLVVVDVVKGGPAEAAGVRQGDVIVSLDGREAAEVTDFMSRVQAAGVGAAVTLGIDRAGESRQIKATLEAMPSPAMGGMGMGYGMGHKGSECPQHAMGMEKQCPMGENCPMGDDCPARSGKPCPQCKAGMKGQGYGMGHGHGYGMMTGRARHGSTGPGYAGTTGPMYGKMMYSRIIMALKGMDLTAEQRSKTAAIRSEYRKKAIKAAADAKIAHMELHEMLASDPVNMEKVRAKVNELGKKKSDMMLSGIKALEDIKKVLTPEQRKSLRETLSMDSSGMETEDDMDGAAGEAAE